MRKWFCFLRFHTFATQSIVMKRTNVLKAVQKQYSTVQYIIYFLSSLSSPPFFVVERLKPRHLHVYNLRNIVAGSNCGRMLSNHL